jgi:hypothetical protein
MNMKKSAGKMVAMMGIVSLLPLLGSAAVIVTDDGADWATKYYNDVDNTGGPAFDTDIITENDTDVWGSGQPGNTTGVEVQGPAAPGPFDDVVIYEGTQFEFDPNVALETGTLSFDYWTDQDVGTMWAYFETPDGSGFVNRWWSLLSENPNNWQTFSATLSTFTSPDTGATLSSQLLTYGISRVGIRVNFDLTALDAQIGLANLEYNGDDPPPIPEPGTYVMLSTALASLGFTFARRRRMDKKA